MGFNLLVSKAFLYNPEAHATIRKTLYPSLQIHKATIRPDVEISDLLKTPKGSELFAVFGQSDINLIYKEPSISVFVRRVLYGG